MSQKNKAVFLDRDGTINIDKGYLYRISDFEFLPGAVEALRNLQEAGYLLIIITNQSGIGRGYYTEEDFMRLTDYMKSELAKSGVNISGVYYCPHLPDAEVERYRKICTCRKPSLGLFERAVHDFNIDLSRSYAIGDKERDIAICSVSECKGFLIGRDVLSLYEAAEIITGVNS
ncbi:MAG: HAD family hydrolase [Synergistaceae bacterium]|nr:HAD family hydrolase [Synergistaceae bacterium]